MIRASEARKAAREALSGKWKKAFLISLLYALFTFAVGFVIGLLGALSGILGGLLTIVEIVIAPPLAYGMAYTFYHLKNGEDVGYGDFLKAGFGNFGRSWGVAWRIFCKCWYLIVIPIVILLIILGIGISLVATSTVLTSNLKEENYITTSYSTTPYSDYYDYLDDYDYNYDYDDYYDYYDDFYSNYNSNYNSDSSSSSEALTEEFAAALIGASAGMMIVVIFVLIIYIVIIVFCIRKLLLYSLSYYIAVANEGIETRDAVQESENLMKGNRGRLFCLILSFIGWALLVSLANFIFSLIPFVGWLLGTVAYIIGLSLLTPYMTFAILEFYQDLIGGNNPNAHVNVGANQVNQNGPVIGGYNNDGMNAYQNNYNSGVNNGYQNINQINTNTQMNTPLQANTENNIQNVQSPEITSGKKYCKRCGAENTPDATYCTTCGAKLD